MQSVIEIHRSKKSIILEHFKLKKRERTYVINHIWMRLTYFRQN